MTIHYKPAPIKTISPQLAYYYRQKESGAETYYSRCQQMKPNLQNIVQKDKLNPTQLRRMGGIGYTTREREEGEASSNGIDLMKQPRYKPAKHLDARSGIAQ
jgi:hypothetical protein